jgi:hypothetical protein
MKTTLIILVFTMCFFSLSCSKDDVDEKETCYFYSVKISDDCNCDNWECEELYFILENEYNRLKIILDNSNDNCPFVNGITSTGENFSGNLLRITKEQCPDFDFF